jgi:hypothetical protein
MGKRVTAVTLVAVIVAAVACEPRPVDDGPRILELHGPASVERFERFETTARITPEPANPFDPAQIDVQAELVDPSGRTWRAIGFWYQGYSRALVDGREVLTPTGTPVWKVRFAPRLSGRWKWRWTVATAGGSTRSEWRVLGVTTGTNPGFVRRTGADSRYLVHDDGTSYFAIGENTAWYDQRGTFAYDSWYRRLAEQGANYSRLWMPSWAFGLEWSDTGLGDYRRRLDRAWQLDRVIEEGERRGIYTMLSLLNHGPFSTRFNSEWAENPYNAANGGPLAQAGDFFTDARAKQLFKRRLRYIVARWAYSTNVHSWELWNEADLVDGYDAAASVAWHREMADYLRSIDPGRHLVTTSFAFWAYDDAVWAQSGLDYTQFHFYSQTEFAKILPNLAENMATWLPERQRKFALPVLFGEFGVDARGPAETFASDPLGIGLHDGLWAGALSSAFGTGMTWWWDNYIDVEPDRFYPMFGAVARFLHGIHWMREQLAPVAATATSPSRPLLLTGMQGPNLLLLWLKNEQHQWDHPDPVQVEDARLRVTALAAGRWCGNWWDTAAGQPRGPTSVDSSGGAVELPVPRFLGDVALRLHRC